ncbi:hypothetical protein [Bradyrhizobium erythrophlei]|jgi:hypothetical protein|uniref:Uncharacterized protein n=1 Tax=Bradyrhizobium erythrophlei TaxID=1437360 RepID=A0A1M7UXB4_9BRAD|nr:hypothetical protein [Bradyrhizobium erythrophlei]SHN87618.1 hypothetical protein SAMN05444170_7279 [Bradyrhizobium erythrophlei]
MTATSASGTTRGAGESTVAAPAVARFLHLAASPTFALMALSTFILDSGGPGALCAAVGGSGFNGMAPMYLLMAVFHLTPWLKLMSRQHA